MQVLHSFAFAYLPVVLDILCCVVFIVPCSDEDNLTGGLSLHLRIVKGALSARGDTFKLLSTLGKRYVFCSYS